MDYYADAEDGREVEDPTHDDLVRLIGALSPDNNTFFVIYPSDHALEWFVSVTLGAGSFGGYEIDRADPVTGEHDVTTAADPHTIATDIKNWADMRAPADF